MTELKQKPVTVKVWKLTRDNVAESVEEIKAKISGVNDD